MTLFFHNINEGKQQSKKRKMKKNENQVSPCAAQDASQTEVKITYIHSCGKNFCSRERDIHSDHTVCLQCFQNQKS